MWKCAKSQTECIYSPTWSCFSNSCVAEISLQRKKNHKFHLKSRWLLGLFLKRLVREGSLPASGSGSRGWQEKASSCLALSEVAEQFTSALQWQGTNSAEESCDPSSEVQVQFNSQLQEDRTHEHRPSQPSPDLVPEHSWECLHILNFVRPALSWFHVVDLLNHTKDKSISLMSVFASGSLGKWLLC